MERSFPELKPPLAIILANAEKLEQLQIEHTAFRNNLAM